VFRYHAQLSGVLGGQEGFAAERPEGVSWKCCVASPFQDFSGGNLHAQVLAMSACVAARRCRAPASYIAWRCCFGPRRQPGWRAVGRAAQSAPW